MKILGEIKPLFAKYGYKKNGDSFWKLENGFYKLINFQKGRYGDYFLSMSDYIPMGCLCFIPNSFACLKSQKKVSVYCGKEQSIFQVKQIHLKRKSVTVRRLKYYRNFFPKLCPILSPG